MLTAKDLKDIKGVVKEIVDESIERNNANIKDVIDFAIEKSEMRMTEKIEKIDIGLSDFRQEMNREISDIAEMNREFLDKLDNHENRIGKLELKTGLAT